MRRQRRWWRCGDNGGGGGGIKPNPLFVDPINGNDSDIGSESTHPGWLDREESPPG